MQYEIREVSLGGILDQAIKLMKDHFALFFVIVLILYVPFLVVQEYLGYSMETQFSGIEAQGVDDSRAIEVVQESFTTIIVLSVVLLLIFVIVMPLTNAAMIWAVAKKYLGEATSAGDAIGKAFRVLVPLVVTSIIKSIVVGIGFIFLIIPGIYLLFAFYLSSHVVVLEGAWGFAALGRSHKLMKGNMLTAFVLGIVLLIIALVMMFIAAIFPAGIVQVLVSGILQGVAVILGAAAGVVLYFSARCKHENFDLTMLAKSVGQEAGAAQAQD